MNTRYFFGHDFDGNIADTFSPSPNRIDVSKAYSLAIERVFGQEGADIYIQQGGLKNRSPVEIACDLINTEERIISRAEIEPGEDPAIAIAEKLVQEKLSILLGEIGQEWPLSFPGVRQVFEILATIGIPIGILSSGHKPFIEKTIKIWGFPSPEVMVTEDCVRKLKYPINACERVKPAVLPFSILHQRWLGKIARNGSTFVTLARKTRQGMIYTGDDPIKDGGLARNARVPFGFFNPKSRPFDGKEFPPGSFSFTDWNHLAEFMSDPVIKKMFEKGNTTSEIFMNFGE